MQTLTIELTGINSLKAIKDLEHKNLIRIVNDIDFSSYALPGDPISEDDFKKWIEYAENSPTVSITEAKQKWDKQKKKLKNISR
jgi:predicted ATP-grasp superfamily ATP-dependent carboligase